MKNHIRFLSAFFSLIFAFSSFSVIPAFSEKTVNMTDNNLIRTQSSSSIDSYLSKYGKEYYRGDTITVHCEDFITGSSDIHKDYMGKNAVFVGQEQKVEIPVQITTAGLYEISFDYVALSSDESSIEAGVSINGKLPYEEADNIVFPRLWINKEKVKRDINGNDITPIQIQKEEWQNYKLHDSEGLYILPLKFYFDVGQNNLSFSVYLGSIAISAVNFEPVTEVPSYKNFEKNNLSYKTYSGKNIVLQGQDAKYKTSKELRPISDKSDPAVEPSDAFHTRINCVGGNNWNTNGKKITWEFDVPEDALYTLAFNYRQNYVSNTSSIRKILIDGNVPFAEAYDMKFPYTSDWSIINFGNDNPYKIYLTKGMHTISLEVCLGEVSDISRRMKRLINDIGRLYREIVMITGSSPDANRDYRLFEQLPDLNKNLGLYKEQIDELVKEYNAISKRSGGTNSVVLQKLGLVLERMKNSKFDAHEYVVDMFNNYSSASAWVYEMRSMPLDIEKIILSGDNADYSSYKSTRFERFKFGTKKLIASFVVDYNDFSKVGDSQAIDVWVNLGRDQANVLTRMVEDSFTPQTGIKVNVKLSTATMIQAKLSGNAPDCTLMQERTIPVNLAMRGALYDLSDFDDLDQVVKERYGREDIITPYKYKGGVYGLPDTETYDLMYIRNDVFEQLGLQVPKTWDDFIRCASVIMRNNLSVWLPQLYTTFLYQFGGKLYKDDLSATDLNTPEAYKAFEYFCSLYTEYKFPVEISFYNRFRTGETPMGIAPMTEFATLMSAASEINGVWNVYPIPGVLNDGEMNNTIVGGGTAAVILNGTKNPKNAWEFIKWWTDTDAQYRYTSDVEAIAGVAARHISANVHTLAQLSWGRNNLSTILDQYNVVTDLPQVPGGYYLTRAINNAFFSVRNNNEDPKKMLLLWSGKVDEEMARKIKEYS